MLSEGCVDLNAKGQQGVNIQKLTCSAHFRIFCKQVHYIFKRQFSFQTAASNPFLSNKQGIGNKERIFNNTILQAIDLLFSSSFNNSAFPSL
jgi:hypothetical protein